jgi:hypothetical protein
MPLPAIEAPAGFVPAAGVSFSGAGGTTVVDFDNPLPIAERSFRGAVTITPGTDQPPRRGIAIVCTSSGTVRLRLADGSELPVPVSTGLTILPFQVSTVVPTGTTATASYANLI